MQDSPQTTAGVSSLETPTTAVSLTARIVAAFLSNNPVAVAELPNVIQLVHRALSGVNAPEEPVVAEKLTPAVSVKKSVTPDFIICLEDGKKLKMLKRHLATTYRLTPDEYRAKWGLPQDYPMTAPSYAAQRSTLAKAAGLGRPAAPGTRSSGRPKKSVA